MFNRPLTCAAMVASALLGQGALPAASKEAPTEWDGLVKVPAKNVDYLYLRPGADFRSYHAIMLEPTQVAFRKNWQRDMNSSRRGGGRISDTDVRQAIEKAQAKLNHSFEKQFRSTGLAIVSAPGADTLKVFVGVANVDVTAPEMNSAGRSRVYSDQAGQATLVVEVRDSVSGELLGRAVDHGYAGDHLATIRNSVTNWSDFGQLFDEWSAISAKGFRRLLDASSK